MNLQDKISQHFADSIKTQQASVQGLSELISYASQRMVFALLNDKKILACGNGRSATAVQLLSSAMLNQYERERPALPLMALTTDQATLTAIASDYHFDEVYAKQVRALGQSGDILVVISDGYHCANLVKVINAAHDKDISVLALTGNKGDMISPLLNETDIEICVPSHSAIHIHEVHVLIVHCLCNLIDQQLFG
ncbi:MAG: SIS domain-containing protein [Methylovulum sp.]|jgi:D-sedoheptulose 7-phosphate isomerase|nr:SIS domain-containing protein [Methylovulum sp.]TSA40147.1 MAG: SIS domain-containing protein [Methylococcaceae bacterium]